MITVTGVTPLMNVEIHTSATEGNCYLCITIQRQDFINLSHLTFLINFLSFIFLIPPILILFSFLILFYIFFLILVAGT